VNLSVAAQVGVSWFGIEYAARFGSDTPTHFRRVPQAANRNDACQEAVLLA
jgi:hypothetical protein